MNLAAKNAKCAKKAWPMVRLGDVCEKKIKRLRQINDEEFEYIDISSIDRKTKSIVSTKEYQRGDAPGRAQQVVEEGDVLVSTVRPNLNAVAVVGKKQKLQRIASTGFCVLRPSANILSEYIFYCVQHDEFIAALVGVAEKAAYPSVTDDEVKNVSIPLPPLPVQREIVARLEKELGEADALAAKFKEVAENADAEFKAELDETFKNVEGEKVRLGDVCETLSTRGHQIKQSEIVDEGRFPVVSQSENSIEGYTDTEVQIEDVPLVLFGDHTCCVKIVDFPFVVGADGTKLIKSDSVNIRYLFRFAQWVSNAIVDGKYRRHFADLMNSEIVMPDNQFLVASKLDRAEEKYENLKAAAERGLRAAEDLRKAILAEAFEQ